MDQILQRLAEPRRVLVIGAHPDDEDTAVLTLAARAYGADAAYLSLSRGEGGQNLIGEELGPALGLVRTRELESARAVDGAQQFFTRAYDFGYTRSLAETERFWPPDSILKDAVRIVRRFRPHVIVTVFSGTPRDGHGQHQMAGVVARQAFEVAGDTATFPELAGEEGLAPWTPLKLYQSTRFRGVTTLALPMGGLDPLTGRSYLQIALASRSRHRSQDFGSIERTGPGEARLGLLASRVGDGDGESDLFDGVPRAGGWLVALADSLRRSLVPTRMDEAVGPLATALRRLQRPRPSSFGLGDAVSPPEQLLHEALGIAAGLVLDARASGPVVVPGESLQVELELYNGGRRAVTVYMAAARGALGGHEIITDGIPLPPGTEWTDSVLIVLDAGTRPTRPYFQERPLVGALYDWSRIPAAVRGLPFRPEPLWGEVIVEIAGTWVRLSREVTYRYADQAIGEIREPVRVVPLIDVELEPAQLVWRASGPETQELVVTLGYNGTRPVRGEVMLAIDGWSAPLPRPFSLERAGATQRIRFSVAKPAGTDRADATVRAIARTQDGATFNERAVWLAYPHVRPTQMMVPAESRISVAPIALPPGIRTVGYIRGASDRVPEALQRIGVPLELIGRDTLADGDLGRYDVVVVGARAYETDTALTNHNDRLLEYVAAGGLLVVQYQQYAFVRGGYAPYPLSIARPHDRITDETSPVTLLAPDHRVFRVPNRLGPDDWDEWPQERGLYFAGEWDEAYTPLLEMRDPDRDPVRGGLLVASAGRGTYVYTGLSFFRALPAGTPGAYRLFMNLLAVNHE